MVVLYRDIDNAHWRATPPVATQRADKTGAQSSASCYHAEAWPPDAWAPIWEEADAMSWTNRVVWQEGMFLRTQHFQQQDRWTEQLVRGARAGAAPASLGHDRLRARSRPARHRPIRAASATGVFEDGTPFALPGETDHPPPLDLPESARNVLVYLALPIRQAGAVEVADSGHARAATRARPFEAYDTHSASPQPAELQIGRLRLRYLLETDERTGYLCIGLARVTEVTADRRIVLDERWIPPALVCSAAPPLAGLIAELAGMLNQRGEALAARHDRAGPGGRRARSPISCCCNRSTAGRTCWRTGRMPANIHPEALYAALVQMAGEFATFTETPATERLSGLSP